MKRNLFLAKPYAIVIIFVMLLSSFQSQEENWYCDDLKNSYQIQVTNTRRQITVPADICDIVRNNRKKSEIVEIELYENIVLRIFPLDQLNGSSEEIPQIVYL